MAITDWIKDHQTLVGIVVIGVLVVGGGVATFFIIRSIRRRLREKKFDVPPVAPAGYIPEQPKGMGIFQKIKEAREEMRTKKVKPMSTAPVAAPVAAPTVSGAPAVDVNSLTVEQLEQLIVEKKQQAVMQTKQATLMAMGKEELVQIILDNQIEI